MLSTTDFVWTQREGCIFPLALVHLFQTRLGDFQFKCTPIPALLILREANSLEGGGGRYIYIYIYSNSYTYIHTFFYWKKTTFPSM